MSFPPSWRECFKVQRTLGRRTESIIILNSKNKAVIIRNYDTVETSPYTEAAKRKLEKFIMTALWEVPLFTVSTYSGDYICVYKLPVKAESAPCRSTK